MSFTESPLVWIWNELKYLWWCYACARRQVVHLIHLFDICWKWSALFDMWSGTLWPQWGWWPLSSQNHHGSVPCSVPPLCVGHDAVHIHDSLKIIRYIAQFNNVFLGRFLNLLTYTVGSVSLLQRFTRPTALKIDKYTLDKHFRLTGMMSFGPCTSLECVCACVTCMLLRSSFLLCWEG